MNVVLRLMEAAGEFVWWGGVCTVIFVSNPTTVLKLCCVVVGVATIMFITNPMNHCEEIAYSTISEVA